MPDNFSRTDHRSGPPIQDDPKGPAPEDALITGLTKSYEQKLKSFMLSVSDDPVATLARKYALQGYEQCIRDLRDLLKEPS